MANSTRNTSGISLIALSKIIMQEISFEIIATQPVSSNDLYYAIKEALDILKITDPDLEVPQKLDGSISLRKPIPENTLVFIKKGFREYKGQYMLLRHVPVWIVAHYYSSYKKPKYFDNELEPLKAQFQDKLAEVERGMVELKKIGANILALIELK